jgi:CheY-like chemotaxis protein
MLTDNSFEKDLREINHHKMQDNTLPIDPFKYLNGKKILIVEDEVSNYELLLAMLRKSGAQFSWARNGREAVGLCENDNFDLILMDIKMPELSGYEAVNQLRAKNQKMPIIAQTAYARVEDEIIILKRGFDGYISKPIDKNRLLKLLEKSFLEHN